MNSIDWVFVVIVVGVLALLVGLILGYFKLRQRRAARIVEANLARQRAEHEAIKRLRKL